MIPRCPVVGPFFRRHKMVTILTFILGLALCVQAFIGLTFFISSIQEKEKRASILSGLQLLGMLVLVAVFFYLNNVEFFDKGAGLAIMICALIAGALGSLILFSRIGSNPRALQGTKGLIVGEVMRVDGKTLPPPGGEMPGPPPPEKVGEAGDTHIMASKSESPMGGGPPPNPIDFLFGGMGKMDKPYEGPNVAAQIGSFMIPMLLGSPEAIKPKGSDKTIELSPEEATERIKGYTLNLGAKSVGIAELNPLWTYSNHGLTSFNPADFGKKINVDHKYAIVFTDEMSFELVSAAPHTPTSIETMVNYAKGAFISVQLAHFIANLGYSATANHMGHYETLTVPLAVDAGLGECSRMGYIITKELGPRARLSVVTTDLPLILDKPVDIGVEDFCRICKKCAVNCPSGSIPHGDLTEVNGTLRWEHNGRTCAERWRETGTDCGICMKVCPWGHAKTFPHKLIVEAVSRNKSSRRVFSIMDDVFYGRKPEAQKGPGWVKYYET
jgi:reductive dehalogenase